MPHTNQSVLSRVGQGLVAFGAGTTSSNIDTIRANRDIAEQNVELNQQKIDAQQDEIKRRQETQGLISVVQAGGVDATAAANRLFQINPEMADQLFESMGATSSAQREDAARRAAAIQATPFDQREAIILEQAEKLRAEGRDPSDTESLIGQSEQDQNTALTITQAAALSAKERLTAQRGADAPTEIRTREQLLADATNPDLSDDDPRKASALVDLGLQPRAGASAQERIALNKQLTDLVAASQAQIREAGKFAEATGADRAKRIDKGFESIQRINTNIRNLDQATAALDAGATTGAVVTRFTPTVRASTVALEQIQAQLGLDVVQAVQFGALSEGELTLALATALPTGLQPDELREWITGRQAAQRKLRDYYSNQIQFLDQGGTIAGFLRSQEGGEVLRFDAQGNRTQ